MSKNPFRGGDTFTPIYDEEKRLDMNAKEYRISYTNGDMVYWRDDTDTPRHRHYAHFLKAFRMTGVAAHDVVNGSIVTMIGRRPGYGPHKDMTVGNLYRIFGCTPGNIRYTDDVGDGCTIDYDEVKSTFALGLVDVPVGEPVEETPVTTPTTSTVELEKHSVDRAAHTTSPLDVGIVIALLASRGKDITAEQARLILRVIDTMTEF